MAIPVPAIPFDEEFAPLPLHEEEDVPEGSLHHRWATYLYNVLRALFPHRFAAGNVCIYWEPGDTHRFVAPDVFLVDGAVPEPPPRSYRAWRLPRVLFAAEIGSLATAERGAKLDRYSEQLQPREVLYTEPVDEEKGERLTAERVQLHRWNGAAYDRVEGAVDGRVWSVVLASWIGVDEVGDLRIYDLQGKARLNYEELDRARDAAEERAREEALQRAAAEERAREEAQQRAAAEERAGDEARQRAAAEERAQEAERRLAELLAQLEKERA